MVTVTKVSNAMYRKAVEISNRPGHVFYMGKNTWGVFRQDTGTLGIVTLSLDSAGRGVFRSSGQYYDRTGRTDTYITAVKVFNEIPVAVRE